MKRKKEPSLEDVKKEYEQAFVEILKDPSLLDEWTLFSDGELEWLKETWNEFGKESSEYASFRLSPRELSRRRNIKSRLKAKVQKATLDLARVQWIHRAFDDRAYDEMVPINALYLVVLTSVFRLGYPAAAMFALAIENGLRLNAIKMGEGEEFLEFQVPIVSRFSMEKLAEFGRDVVTRAFEKVAEDMAACEKRDDTTGR